MVKVLKRDCSEVDFDKAKISRAIMKANEKWWCNTTKDCRYHSR